MNSRTEIPAYDTEEFAETEDTTHRDTRVPAFDVGLLARAADVEVSERAFELSDVPIWGSTSSQMSGLDHRVAFLMLNIDGLSSFETVIRLSHVPEAEARVALTEMLATGLIAIRGRRPQDVSDEAPGKPESGMWSRETSDQATDDGERWTFVVQSAGGMDRR
ncbi:MAG TPA: hypothetical protein VM925_24590 [Labilithrix sp.]|nr:hypothetical protein [Labilithrix sp.]